MKKISLALITLLLITCVGCTSKTDANSTPEPTPAVATPTPEPDVTPTPEPKLDIELPPVEVTYNMEYDINKDGSIDKAEWEAYVSAHPEDINKDMVYTVDESEKYEAQQEQQKPEQTTPPSTTTQPSTNQGQSSGSQGTSGETTRPTETTPTPTPPPAPPKPQQTTPPDDSSKTAQQVQDQLERDQQQMTEADRQWLIDHGYDPNKDIYDDIAGRDGYEVTEDGGIRAPEA